MKPILEKCFQCGNESPRHPVVGVIDVETLMQLERMFDIIELRDDNKFALVPFCAACHREPKQGGHFFYRQDASHGLTMAGSENLG